MKVWVDSREKKLVAETLRRQGFDVEVKYLNIGDIETDRVIIERKSTADVYGSVISGRLKHQMDMLTGVGKVPILAVHGSPLQAEDPDVCTGAVASCSVRYGVHVIWIEDEYDCLVVLSKVIKKIHQEKLGVPWVYNIPGLDRRIVCLVNLYRVSPIIAKRLLKQFGSIRAILEADEKKLQMVKGIGKVKAKLMYELVNKEWRK